MLSPQLQSLTIGDLLWLPEFGDKSPMWLVVAMNCEISWSGSKVGHVELLELEDCYSQIVAFGALNRRMSIL